MALVACATVAATLAVPLADTSDAAVVNVAAGKPATQSSTWGTLTADRAVDGNPNTIFATQRDSQPWWQVDLGQWRDITSVRVLNRTDCCGERLQDGRLFVSRVEFPVNATVAQLEADPDVTTFLLSTSASQDIAVNTSARYVRVQIPRQEYLNLREVEVFADVDVPGGDPAEHPAIDPSTISNRPMSGGHGVIGERGLPRGSGGNPNDTTPSLDVTVWDMQQAGDHMYVGGEFSRVVRNSGDAGTVQRYLARFDIHTGQWDSTFRPVLDGNVHALELSPRGKLLVGGEFTSIDGVPGTAGLASIDPLTGQVDTTFGAWVERPWYPQGRAIVRELEVVGDRLYVVGKFSHIHGAGGTRTRVHSAARVSANYGTIDPDWVPQIQGGSVWGLAINQRDNIAYMVGRFLTVNGGPLNSHQFAVVDTITGATVHRPEAARNTAPGRQRDAYDVEWGGDTFWLAGSEHTLTVNDAHTHQMYGWNSQGDRGDDFAFQGGAGGDYQFAEKIGDFVYAGCHCNEPRGRNGSMPQGTHYSSFTNSRSEHVVAMAYYATGPNRGALYQPLHLDIGGGVDGGWTAATDTNGCLWIGGDIVNGGFRTGRNVFARGFARFCDDRAPNPVQQLQGAVGAGNVVNLTWVAPNGGARVAGYHVVRDGRFLGFVEAGTTSFQDATAAAGLSYTYEVRSESTLGLMSVNSPTIEVTVGAPDTEAPTVPDRLRATVGAGNAWIDVSWRQSTDNVGVSGYLVYRNGGYIGFTEGNGFRDSSVDERVNYRYTVRAVDLAGNRSDESAPIDAIAGDPDTQPPTVPAAVQATDDGGGQVTVSWAASDDDFGVQSYLVFRNGGYIAWTRANTLQLVDTGRALGVPVTYTVRAVDTSDNRSDASAGTTVVPGGVDDQPPAAPAAVQVDDLGGGDVRVTWTAAEDNIGIRSYLVYRNGRYVGWRTADNRQFDDTGRQLGVPVTYEVRAVDPSGNRSPKSAPVSISPGGVDDQPPTAPAPISATDLGGGSVRVNWAAATDNVGIRSYLVYRDGAYIGWTEPGTRSFTDTGRPAGVSARYEVRAIDTSDNRSPKAGPATVTPGP